MTQIPGLDTEAFLKATIDPTNTAEVFKIQSALLSAPRRPEMIQWIEKALGNSEEFLAMYKERYNPRLPTTEELLAFPVGSLGRELGNHLFKNDIQLDFSGLDTSMFYQTDMSIPSYFATRSIRTHDIYHTVLGLGTSPLDEFRIHSFLLAQYGGPYHMTLMASAYLNTAFYSPKDIPEFVEAMAKYHRVGKEAEFFPGFPFENHWETPISKVREMLKVS